MTSATSPNSGTNFLTSPHAFYSTLFAITNTFAWARVGSTLNSEDLKASGIALGAIFGSTIGLASIGLKYVQYSSTELFPRRIVSTLTPHEGMILGFGLVIALFGPYEDTLIGNTTLAAGGIFGAALSCLLNKYAPIARIEQRLKSAIDKV